MSLEEIKESSLDSVSELNPADGQELQTSEREAKIESPAEIIKTPEKEIEAEDTKVEDTYAGEIDQELYKEVLEKLDITPREKDLQEKTKLEKKIDENSHAKVEIEKAIAGDFSKIQQLMQAGLINSAQGQNLKKQVLKKAFDKLVQTEKIKRSLSPAANLNQANSQSNPNPINNSAERNQVFEEFSKRNPDFFTPHGRKEVLDYLKSDNVIVGKDDLSKISGIIRTVEKAAIDRYLKKVAHEKTLRDSNEVAKQRLTANAQKSSSSGNLLRTFTREQIGKMSSAEFTKYESSIMEQLKKGQIR